MKMIPKTKILIYSTAYFPLVGGAEVAVKELTDRLVDYDFDLITAKIKPGLAGSEIIGRVRVYRVGWGTKWDKIWLMLWGPILGSRLNQQNNYCVVWAIMASFAGLAASRFKKIFPEIPFLLTLQEGDDLSEIEKKVKWFRREWLNIFRQANAIQAISNYLADWARNLGAKAPVVVIPNGVEIERFLNIEQIDKQEQKNKIIISTSRLVKKNGLSDLIKATAYLPANIKLRLVGIGPEESNLRKLVADLKLDGRVEFVGMVPPEEISEQLAVADVFCRPSLSEGLGNSFLEAMAAGLPVVATPVGGIPDFLIDGKTGWFARPNDPKDLAGKIAEILEPKNQEKIAEVVAEAKNLVNNTYRWSNLANRFKILLQDLCLKNH